MTTFTAFKLNSNPLSQLSGFASKSVANFPQVATPAIHAKGVEVVVPSGGQDLPILRGIDLSIPKGSIQLLMGPSGSGKTTLLTVLAGLFTPTAGKVNLLGEDITRMSAKQLTRFRLQNIGFIFQDFNLFPALSAAENVEAVLHLKGIKGKAAQLESRQLLEQVGLGDRVDHKPRDLSGGQKQRVAIARALAGSPKLIMADEPTASLDSTSGRLVMELLRDLAKDKGCTVLMVTHDARILDLADRINYLEDGLMNLDCSAPHRLSA